MWTGYQAQRWLARLAREIGESKPDEVESLKLLRNALEHLDTALFDESGMASADPNDRSAWSLRKLGGPAVQSWAARGPCLLWSTSTACRDYPASSRTGWTHWSTPLPRTTSCNKGLTDVAASKSASPTPAFTVRSGSAREYWWDWCRRPFHQAVSQPSHRTLPALWHLPRRMSRLVGSLGTPRTGEVLKELSSHAASVACWRRRRRALACRRHDGGWMKF